MLRSLLKAVRPKLELVKTIEDAANAVDDMFNSVFQGAGKKHGYLTYVLLIQLFT